MEYPHKRRDLRFRSPFYRQQVDRQHSLLGIGSLYNDTPQYFVLIPNVALHHIAHEAQVASEALAHPGRGLHVAQEVRTLSHGRIEGNRCLTGKFHI